MSNNAVHTFNFGDNQNRPVYDRFLATAIATIEDENNTSRSYAIGEEFYRNNVLCRAKVPIASGTAWSSLTLNTDYEVADNVSSQIQVIANNVDTLEELVEGSAEITTKAYASVISVNDALPVNAVDVSAKIEPIQAGSGTPSPSNVRAISGRSELTVTRTGKNLAYFDSSLTGYVSSTNGNIEGISPYFHTDYIPVKPNTAYTIKNFCIKNSNAGALYDENKQYIRGISASDRFLHTFLTPANAHYVRLSINSSYSEYQTLQFEEGSTATTYEPYSGEDYTIQLGDTIYGGTLDVTTGVLTVDRAIKDLGDLSWSKDTATRPADGATIHAFYAAVSDAKKWSYNFIYSCYESKPVDVVDYGGKTQVLDAIASDSADSHHNIWVYESRYNDYSTTEFKAAMSGVQCCYYIENPYTIQLTPQDIQLLQNNNTIFADSGDVSMQYYANDVKNLKASVAAIQGDVNELETAVAKCECLILSASSVNALPYTFSNAAIETDMVCVKSILSNPGAQTDDWTVNTNTAGQCTISGDINGTTNITVYLMKSRY